MFHYATYDSRIIDKDGQQFGAWKNVSINGDTEVILLRARLIRTSPFKHSALLRTIAGLVEDCEDHSMR